jgi:hypothetical protein
MGREPSLTFEGALRILGQHELPGIEKLDKVLGGVILAAGVGAGLAAVGPAVLAPLTMFSAVWGWLEQKDTAIGLLRGAIAGLSGKLAGTRGRERRELIAAAHTVIVVAAFFEAFREQAGTELYDRLKITDDEKKALITQPVARSGESVWEAFYAAEVPAPSAARGFEENVYYINIWFHKFSSCVNRFVSCLAAGEKASIHWTPVVASATERYRSHFLALAAKVPEFMIWAMLNEGAATRSAVADLRARQAGQFDAVLADGAATRAVVDGLRADMAAALDANRDALGRLAALLALDAGQFGGIVPDLRQSLAWANHGVLADKIIPEDAQSYAGIGFPTVEESYVNPRYRLARTDTVPELIDQVMQVARPARESWWGRRPSRDDFDLMLAAHVISPEATRRPMLLLGHPGAGKSMLTKVFAARLPSSAYTVVRVPLRRVAANAPVRTQIEQALADATNGRVDSWWQLAAQSQGTIRVVLLDGLDELLQASQDDRSGYLQDVMEFQQHEAEQRQPVVVVVTSRTVVADRVDIPDGTTVVKLDFFSEPDIADWLDRWRRVNAAAISAGTMRALTAQSILGTPAAAAAAEEPENGAETAPDREDGHADGYATADNDQAPGPGGVRELARQPLLLLMLALYAADPAQPPLDHNVASAELYQRLIESFCRREAAKALGPNPSREQVAKLMRDHLDRLEVAALAMFNRGRQDIGEEELGADLAVLDPRLMDRSRPVQVGQRIIGEFLFVHAPEARLLSAPGTAGAGTNSADSARREPPRRSYEFLHATFGEYLVASRVMNELAEAAARSFAGRRGPTEPDDDLLYALLSHQALATSKPTLAFAGEIFAWLGDRDREQVLAVLELLLACYRRRQGTATYAGYRPTTADTVRELAFYSANLVALRAWLEPDHAVIPLPRLLGHPADDARETPDNRQEQWRSTVMLWKSGLDPDGLQAMLTTVSFSGDEPGICVSGLVNTGAGWATGDPISVVGDILLARLTVDQGLAERVRYGAAILDGQLITFAETSWKDAIASWLIPAIAGHRIVEFPWEPPPAMTPRKDIDYVAELIFRYLRTRGAGLGADHDTIPILSLLKLLFLLPGLLAFDSLALASTVISRPELLTAVPELQNAEIYGQYQLFMRELTLPGDRKLSDIAAAVGRKILREFATGQDNFTRNSFQDSPRLPTDKSHRSLRDVMPRMR